MRAVILGLAIFLSMHAAAFAEKNPPSKPIDLNVANIKELQELPGVGAVTAQRIIDLRQKSGRFHRVEDLLAVRGISPKKLEAMRKYVTVSVAPAAIRPAPKPASPPKTGSPCTGCGTTNHKYSRAIDE
jgi:competence ComEA-like helix-hairpin-helix protein